MIKFNPDYLLKHGCSGSGSIHVCLVYSMELSHGTNVLVFIINIRCSFSTNDFHCVQLVVRHQH